MTSKKSYLRKVALATGLLMVPMASAVVEPAKLSTAEAEGLFAAKVLPLFKAKCFACHGDDPKKIKGKFLMHTREGMLKGGESELPALIPGKPEESPLYLAITWKDEDLEMPPKENDRLDKQQIAWVRAWIAAGAVPGELNLRVWDLGSGALPETVVFPYLANPSELALGANHLYFVDDVWGDKDIYAIDLAEGQYIQSEILPPGDAADCSEFNLGLVVLDEAEAAVTAAPAWLSEKKGTSASSHVGWAELRLKIV